MTEVHCLHEELAIQQDNLATLALRGSGDYELSFLYKAKGISAHAWTMLTHEKQQQAIKKFKNMPTPSKPKYLLDERQKNLSKIYRFGSKK